MPEAPTQLLSSVAEIQPGGSPEQINHYTVQRVIDVGANVHGRDLGAVATDIQKRIDGLGKLPPGMRITLARPEPGHEPVVPHARGWG